MPRAPRGSLGGPLVESARALDRVGTFWHLTDWHLNAFQPEHPDPCTLCTQPMRAGAAMISAMITQIISAMLTHELGRRWRVR